MNSIKFIETPVSQLMVGDKFLMHKEILTVLSIQKDKFSIHIQTDFGPFHWPFNTYINRLNPQYSRSSEIISL